MKKLIVALIVLTPFIGVSTIIGDSSILYRWRDIKYKDSIEHKYYTTSGWIFMFPDTLSAYLLVTTKHMGIAYQRRGFVVRQYGKEDVFLDCDKRVLKAPFNVWQFRIINQPK